MSRVDQRRVGNKAEGGPTNLSGAGRFDERRRALAREADRRRIRTVGGLAAVTSLALMLIGFVNSSWFDIDEIVVVGTEQAEAPEVIAASGLAPGDGLLSIDFERAQAGVEAVPWVSTAAVERSWRGRITVSVAERSALAALPIGDRFALVDRTGRQLEVVASRPDGFLPIVGLEAAPGAGEPAPSAVLPLLALLDVLPERSMALLSRAEFDSDGLALILRQDDARVVLGDGELLTEKLQAFETVLARVDTSCLAVLDLRVPAAPIIRRHGSDLTSESPSEGEVPDSAPADC